MNDWNQKHRKKEDGAHAPSSEEISTMRLHDAIKRIVYMMKSKDIISY